MKDPLITFETAVLAKNKKFDIPVRYGVMGQKMKLTENHGWENHKALELRNWNTNKANSYSIPTQSLLQKWLREIHNIHVQPFYHPNTISTREIKPEIEIVRVFAKDGITKSILPPSLKGEEFDTYEEALESGLQEALKLINL